MNNNTVWLVLEDYWDGYDLDHYIGEIVDIAFTKDSAVKKAERYVKEQSDDDYTFCADAEHEAWTWSSDGYDKFKVYLISKTVEEES